jgi:mannose-6-phosphate isomerase-like protein (cupin superfamily)
MALIMTTTLTKKIETETRPWGEYFVIDQGECYKVKRITVYPGGKLSLQYHNYRSEHWTIVSGTGSVKIGNKNIIVGPNESVYIDKKEIHTIENMENNELVLIEVQHGKILEENDIIRISDIYGRI